MAGPGPRPAAGRGAHGGGVRHGAGSRHRAGGRDRGRAARRGRGRSSARPPPHPEESSAHPHRARGQMGDPARPALPPGARRRPSRARRARPGGADPGGHRVPPLRPRRRPHPVRQEHRPGRARPARVGGACGGHLGQGRPRRRHPGLAPGPRSLLGVRPDHGPARRHLVTPGRGVHLERRPAHGRVAGRRHPGPRRDGGRGVLVRLRGQAPRPAAPGRVASGGGHGRRGGVEQRLRPRRAPRHPRRRRRAGGGRRPGGWGRTRPPPAQLHRHHP